MKQMSKLFSAVSNDFPGEVIEGKIKNCRWQYTPTSFVVGCGILSFASNGGFDRWSNSRIVDLHTVLWDITDPEFERFVTGIVALFNS